MNRRSFLRTTGTVALLAPAGIGLAQDRQRPNLLVIQTDEHNFRTLGCYRALMPKEQALMWGKDAVVETPHIDWIAKNGATCTKFYATTPVCSPSRAALISGRYPQNTPTTTNNIPLSDDVVSFAEILRRQGYATGYSGKWHLDGGGKPQWAPERQFGFADNRYMYNRGHWKQLEITEQGPRVKARGANGGATYDVKGADAKSFTTDFLADLTVDFIRAHKNEPFCYMVSIPDPHGPNTVRPPYDTMYENMKIETPRTFDKPEESVPRWGAKQKKSFAGAYITKYFGMVKCIDDNVGKILDALRAAGCLERTIVIFTADHGDLCGEHARDNKGVPYEGSAKIPFVLYYPEKVKAGTVVPQALGCVDFLPTALGLMGVKTAGKEEGRDASPLFTGASKDWNDIAFLRGTSSSARPGAPSISGWLAAVTGRYKLVLSPTDEPWLYDLEKDPDELKNLLRDPAYRETIRTLSKALIQYCEKYNDPNGAQPRIQADLKWGASGSGPYQAPKGIAPPKPAAKAAAEKTKQPRRRKQKAPAKE